jgi:hypothetical protein
MIGDRRADAGRDGGAALARGDSETAEGASDSPLAAEWSSCMRRCARQSRRTQIRSSVRLDFAERLLAAHRPGGRPLGESMDDNTMAVAVVALIASGTVLSFFAFFVGRAWAERIRGAHRVEGGEAVKALREDMQVELQQVRHELGELAERVDFTERLLSKQREAARLGPPQ